MVDFSHVPEYSKSDEELKTYALEYLRDCQNKEYRRLARKGLLEEHLQEQADAARAYAEDLIKQGQFPPQAWHWAIRVKLLDSEMD